MMRVSAAFRHCLAGMHSTSVALLQGFSANHACLYMLTLWSTAAALWTVNLFKIVILVLTNMSFPHVQV